VTVDRIVIVAGETSGDNLAAGLIKALNARRPGLSFEGVAGPAMQAAGCTAWANSSELAVMGLVEVLAHLPRLLALRRRVVDRALAQPPALFIGVDAPEFNLGLAARLRSAGIPTVQYVSPQVWAWRQGRVAGMSRTLDLVLCLLPFERTFYQGFGLAAEFVGHPLADKLPLVADRVAARQALGVPADAVVIALLPGSREGEVRRLAGDFIAAARLLAERRPGLRFLAPMATAEAGRLFEAELAARGGADLPIQCFAGRSSEVLTAADCVLVASGTATLETLLCKRPMVVAYRVGGLTAWLARRLRLVKARYFSQPNLLAGREVVPELLQEAVTPERIASEVERWLDHPEEVAKLVDTFGEIHETLRRGASERAADAVLALLESRRLPECP